MSLREDIFDALTAGSPLLRAYPEVLPQTGAVLPALTYNVVGGHDDFYLDGPSGARRRLLQVDAWAGTRLSADVLIEQAQTLLLESVAFTVNGVSETGADGYEPDTQRYRASREFVLWTP